jgi:hypothetical protein
MDESKQFSEGADWAGKDFRIGYPEGLLDSWPFNTKDEMPFPFEEAIEANRVVDHAAPGTQHVPLTYYEGGEIGVGERHVIGCATVKSDGSFSAVMDDGTTIEGNSGLIGPINDRPFSFGRPVDAAGKEIALTPGEGKDSGVS